MASSKIEEGGFPPETPTHSTPSCFFGDGGVGVGVGVGGGGCAWWHRQTSLAERWRGVEGGIEQEGVSPHPAAYKWRPMDRAGVDELRELWYAIRPDGTDGHTPRKIFKARTEAGGSSELENIQEYTYLHSRASLLLPRLTLWYTLVMDLIDDFPSATYEPAAVVIPMDKPTPVPRPVSTEVIDILPEKNIPEEIALPPLSVDEDSFALAVIECGGNLAAAYRSVFGNDVGNPGARGQTLMMLPQVAHRITELSHMVRESAMVSMGMHLQELAVIRDMAKVQGQLKVALQAERTRGEVTGLYDKFEHGAKDKGPTSIQINLVSKYDVNI